MMDYLVTPCGNSVSQKEAAIMSEQREYLMSVLDRLRVKTREDKDVENPGRFMSEFSKIYSQIDKKHLNEELDAYHNIYSTYRQAMDIFFERLRVVGNIEKVKNEHGCLLYELVREANFGIDMILMFVIELNRDLIELASLFLLFSNLYIKV
uniref:CULLIN_2 domain-containing protein n=1 Tax=Caenorhabditis tropicalis TaxID=1561998 RepID=A0A1I7THG8_9PELO